MKNIINFSLPIPNFGDFHVLGSNVYQITLTTQYCFYFAKNFIHFEIEINGGALMGERWNISFPATKKLL